MNPVDFSPLLNFLGYGDLGAALWVLGAEEKVGQRHQNPGLSEPERLQDELRVRSHLAARWTAATVGPTRVYLMQSLGFGKTSKADIEEVVVDARRWREMNEG